MRLTLQRSTAALVLAVALLLFAFKIPASAQNTTTAAILEGVITDPSDAPVGGAKDEASRGDDETVKPREQEIRPRLRRALDQFDSATILRIGLTWSQLVRRQSLKENLSTWTTELFFRMASLSLFTWRRTQSLTNPPTVLLNMSVL